MRALVSDCELRNAALRSQSSPEIRNIILDFDVECIGVRWPHKHSDQQRHYTYIVVALHNSEQFWCAPRRELWDLHRRFDKYDRTKLLLLFRTTNCNEVTSRSEYIQRFASVPSVRPSVRTEWTKKFYVTRVRRAVMAMPTTPQWLNGKYFDSHSTYSIVWISS